ncbi:MAG TPA: tetratricopeptide repeat protein [Candidatus Binatia bacterium]|nr:tetratricopeptide repeat protein [Candidatus Binatia bacterium]
MRVGLPFGLFALGFLVACAGQAPGTKLDVDADPVSRLRRQGDSEFEKMHWRGWKNAVACYNEAREKGDEASLRQKLFTAYVLLSLRETELYYRDESWLQKAEALLPSLPEVPFTGYLAVAQKKFFAHPLNPGGFAHKTIDLDKFRLPGEAASVTPQYFLLKFLSTMPTPDAAEKYSKAENEFRQLHGNSNLAVYLRSYTPDEIEEKLAAFPDFAEMFMLRGDRHRSEKKYQEALADYQQAVLIMPVLYKACNAMAALYYSFEEFALALTHYGQTLEISPLEPTALFGRAICLSELKRFDESDQALKAMIEKQSFYHGEANYYLAKNSYFRSRLEAARSYLDLAAAYIPDSPDLNMLSGLLHLERGQPGQAVICFRKVLELQPLMAEAWFYLGRAVRLEKKDKDARPHFQKAVENFRRELDGFDAKLDEMKKNMGSDSFQKNYYAKRLRQRAEYAQDAIARLAPLQRAYKKPPLSGLGELLTALSKVPDQ